MAINKKDLRKQMSILRNQLDGEEIHKKSHQIFERLIQTDAYIQSEIIFSYASFRSEVDTWELNERVLKDKKILALPRVNSQSEMEFYQIQDLSRLVCSPMGIMEPGPDCPPVRPDGKALILLPGLAFDCQMHRLGYGGGYYDRYLSKYSPPCRRLALAFDLQIIDRVPSEWTDIPMDAILTEHHIIERTDKR